MNLSQMSFDSGILHLANWVGNVIMPTMAAVFIIIAIIAVFKGTGVLTQHVWCLGLSLGLRSDASARNVCLAAAWNNPDVYWIALMTLINWVANVILPVYAAVSGSRRSLANGHVLAHPSHQWLDASFSCSGALPDGFRVASIGGILRRTGYWRRDLKEGKPMALDVTPVYRNLRTRVTFARARSRGPLRDPCGGRGDEYLRKVPEPGDVRNAHEHGAAVRRSHPECSGADAIQVWQTTRDICWTGCMFHTKPHVYSGLERDRELTREYIKD